MDGLLWLVVLAAFVGLWRQLGALKQRLDQARTDLIVLDRAMHQLAERLARLQEESAQATHARSRPRRVLPETAAGSSEPQPRTVGPAPAPEAIALAAIKALPVPAAQWEVPGTVRPADATMATGRPAMAPGVTRATLETAQRPPAPRRPFVPAAQLPAGPGLGERLLDRIGLGERLLDRIGFAKPQTGAAWSRASLEAWLEGRLLAVVGGIALLLGAVFFLSLAFSKGWITEPMRVLIGLGVGAGLLVLGELAFSKVRGIVGHVLVAVGLAVISLALFAATPQLYDLVPVEWALLGAFVAAVAAALIAVRHDSQLVAAFGLIAVLAAPPLLGASPTLITLLFVAAALIGTTAVALFRTWVWLPPLAFILAGPQLASYLTGGPPPAEGLVAVAGFWLVNTVAAGGEETRHATDRLRTSTVTLLLATAAFTLWGGFTILSGPQEQWRGAFLAAMAAAHLALGLFFLARRGDRHPFGLVVAATGIAALTMAAPVQFGGPPVPIAWAAEAVALAWVAVLRRHPYSAGVGILLGAMAVSHLVLIEYPPASLAAGFSRDLPFVGPEGMTFAFLIGALVVAGLAVPLPWVRVMLTAVGGFVAIYVAPFELSGPALVAAWAALSVAGFAIAAKVVAPRLGRGFVETRVAALALPSLVSKPIAQVVAFVSAVTRPAFVAMAGIAGVGVFLHLAAFDYPVDQISSGLGGDIPFVGLPGMAFAIALAALAAAGLLVPLAWARAGLMALGVVVALYVFPFELSGPALVWAWSGLALVAFAVETRIVGPRLRGGLAPGSRVEQLGGQTIAPAGALVALAVLGHLVVLDFPLDRLGQLLGSAFPYGGPEALALAGALAALAAAGVVSGAAPVRLGVAGVGLALIAYSGRFEIDTPLVTVAWAALAIASIALVRVVTVVEPVPGRGVKLLTAVAERTPYAAAGLAFLFLLAEALWQANVVALGEHLFGGVELAGTPFLDERSFVVAILGVAAVATGWLWGGGFSRLVAGVAASLAVAWLLPFEVRPGYAIAGWSLIAIGGFWLLRAAPAERLLLGGVAGGLLAIGGVVALTVVAPPDRLVVDETSSVLGWPLLTDATIALGGLAIAIGIGGWLHRGERLGRPALLAAGVAAVYLLSIAVVDQFQLQVGAQPLDDLQKGGQVGLSVLWSILGGAGFATGIRAHQPPIRLFGLALLGLATVKVFLVDLASLDVAYRVLSLVGLGVLLLVSAMVYSRMEHPHPPATPKHA
jgi:hypothetical protein